MNKKDFVKLCFNYNKEPNEDLYELWEHSLRCYDEEEIKEAINIIISQDKFFPTFSRVLEVVKKVVNNEELNCEDNVRKNMSRLNIHPEWLDKDIINQPIDEETQNEFDDFQNFLREFREN